MKITLKACRVNKGYHQDEAAKRLGISTKTLSYWETGKTFPSAKKIPIIEKVYGVSYNDIIFLN
jgi:transcriptional regulator with XRE-family HTH domain